MIIVDIRGTHCLVSSELGSAMLDGITVVTSSGYGKDEKWAIAKDASISMSAVPDSRLLDDTGVLLAIQEKLTKVESERSALQDALYREKKFWAVRAKAHGMGYTDEALRALLEKRHQWNDSSFVLGEEI